MRILEGARKNRMVTDLERRGSDDLAGVEPVVGRIIADVRRRGDRALRLYAKRWDGLEKNDCIRVSAAELDKAWLETASELQSAIKAAASNIRQYSEWQKPDEWRREIHPGVEVGQLVRPLDSVGCYVPGGRYPLPSTLLMTVIPAQVAGVRKICVVSPKPARAILATAAFLGVSEFYRVGGAQAVAALAYGTASVPRVSKIVGPGNRYVTAAKKLVAFDCSIEFLAGATEALFVSDEGDPALIACDLVAQAEHDPDALCIFITSSNQLAKDVQKEVKRRVLTNQIASESLTKNGVIFLVANLNEALEIANRVAPEHLTLPSSMASAVRNAGSVFLNEFTPQSAGDYISGPNHVLPTGAMARVRGGLSVLDFVRVISCQEISRKGLGRIAPAAITLAEAEGLRGHAESLRVRYFHA
jgi:histidinol dehydrogenase